MDLLGHQAGDEVVGRVDGHAAELSALGSLDSGENARPLANVSRCTVVSLARELLT